MDIKTAKKRIKELSDILKYHNRKYYIEDSPEIEDFEYDALLRELEVLEEEYPEFRIEEGLNLSDLSIVSYVIASFIQSYIRQ